MRAVLCAFQAVEKAFAVPKGFYWQTVESDDKHFPDSSAMEACRDTDTEVKSKQTTPSFLTWGLRGDTERQLSALEYFNLEL